MKKTTRTTRKPLVELRRVSHIKFYLENMRSPTVSTFHNMKIVASPEEIENDRIMYSALDDIKSTIQSTKKQRSKNPY